MGNYRDNMLEKECRECEIIKDIKEFSISRSSKDGYRNKCKGCVNIYNKKYREENKDKINEYSRKYREENKDKIKEYREENRDKMKEYREENRDKLKEYSKVYYEENKDKIKEWREENKDKIKEWSRKYREENKDKIKEWREENKDKIKEWSKVYYEENKDKINERGKKWREENRERSLEYSRKYYEENKIDINKRKCRYYRENKDRIRVVSREYNKNRISNDPLYRLRKRMRTSIYNSLKDGGYTKDSKSNDILGCSYEELLDHLNDNKYGFIYGDDNLDIDHIIPLSRATSEEEIIELNHYSNLQLLPSEYNRYVKIDKDFDNECLEEWLYIK